MRLFVSQSVLNQFSGEILDSCKKREFKRNLKRDNVSVELRIKKYMETVILCC